MTAELVVVGVDLSLTSTGLATPAGVRTSNFPSGFAIFWTCERILP